MASILPLDLVMKQSRFGILLMASKFTPIQGRQGHGGIGGKEPFKHSPGLLIISILLQQELMELCKSGRQQIESKFTSIKDIAAERGSMHSPGLLMESVLPQARLMTRYRFGTLLTERTFIRTMDILRISMHSPGLPMGSVLLLARLMTRCRFGMHKLVAMSRLILDITMM